MNEIRRSARCLKQRSSKASRTISAQHKDLQRFNCSTALTCTSASSAQLHDCNRGSDTMKPRMFLGYCVIASAGILASCEHRTPMESGAPSVGKQARAENDVEATEVGCGVVTEIGGGALKLTTVKRNKLPSEIYSTSNIRRTKSGKALLRTDDIVLESNTSGQPRHAICVVPIDAPISASRQLGRALNSLSDAGQEIEIRNSASGSRDPDALRVALLSPLKSASSELVHRPSSTL